MARRLAPFVLIAALAATVATANPADSVAGAASEAAGRLRAAEAMLAGANGARDRVAALSQTVAAYESGLEALRAALREAGLREAQAKAELAVEEARLQRLTGLMLALGRQTEAGMILHPDGVIESVRAGLVLSDVTQAVAVEASGMRARLTELSDLRQVQDGALAVLAEGLAGAQSARVALSEAVAGRRELPSPYLADPEARAGLLTAADTLDAFAAGLAAISPGVADPAIRAFAAARGSLPPPVRGTLLRGFEETDAAGVRRPGLILATAPGAPVAAPWSATVRYAGALLDYGNVMILEPQAGYLLVLAGLGDVFAAEGSVVAPGTVLGVMPGGPTAREAYFVAVPQAGGANRSETLYMELRDGGAPVDPAPWFTLTGDVTR
jgi:septal ring factor EnvC (AmiA/AmiB activator)